MNIKKILFGVISLLSGITNAIFGSGGGIVAIENFKMNNLNQKSAQATALCSMLIMSAFSAAYYAFNGYVDIKNALIYIPFGIPGALTGSYLLGKLKDKTLKKIFSILIIWAGIRMIFG